MEETLEEWKEKYHSQDEMQQTFYQMDETMKYIHQNSYHITSFHPSKITLGKTENGQSYVSYHELQPFGNNPVEEMNQNIYNLAYLQVGIYSDTLQYLKPEFLKEDFQSFKVFLPEEDSSYYERVLTQKAYFYYSDYRKAKNEQLIDKLHEDLPLGKGTSRSLAKKTAAGKLYNFEDDNHIAAFVQHYLLPFIILSLSLLIPLFAWFIALS